MTLVKSLYSDDTDVIGYSVDVIGLHDRWCNSGKSNNAVRHCLKRNFSWNPRRIHSGKEHEEKEE